MKVLNRRRWASECRCKSLLEYYPAAAFGAVSEAIDAPGPAAIDLDIIIEKVGAEPLLHPMADEMNERYTQRRQTTRMIFRGDE